MSDFNEQVEIEVLKRLNDPAYLREVNLKLIETIKAKDAELEKFVPIKDFYKRVTESDDWMEMATAVKLLAYKGYGRNNTFKFLKNNRILRSNNEPYQEYIDRGYFKIIEEVFELPYGETDIYRKTVVSQKGLDFIRKLIEAEMAV